GCRAKAVVDTTLQHQCDTLGGSSGALVFDNRDYSIVGLHRKAGLINGDPTSFNQATDALAISRASTGWPRPPQVDDVASAAQDRANWETLSKAGKFVEYRDNCKQPCTSRETAEQEIRNQVAALESAAQDRANWETLSKAGKFVEYRDNCK